MPVMTKPGTVLLKCEPFVHAAVLNSPYEICDCCLYTSKRAFGFGEPELKRCSACHKVLYCNKECQIKGWKEGHKFECNGMKNQTTPNPNSVTEVDGDIPRVLLRVLVKLQDGKDYFDVVKTENGEVKRRFKDLISHSEEIKKSDEMMEQVKSMISIAKSYLQFSPTKINIPGEVELLEICGRILINMFCITGVNKLGTAVYLAGSIMDHSCDEMAAWDFEGTTMVVRNIKEIPEETTIDKVTTSYISLVRPSMERRLVFKKRYFFDCQCDRCAAGLLDKEMRSVVCYKPGCNNEIDTEELRNPCGSCGNKLTDKEVEDIVHVGNYVNSGLNPLIGLTLLDQKNFSEGHWIRIKLYENLFKSESDIERGYHYGSKYLNGIRRYHHPNHDLIGKLSAALANVALFLNKIEDAEELKNRAKAVLKVSSGLNSQTYKNLIPELEKKIKQAKSKRN